MKKFTWGTGILLFIILFFVSAVSFIIWTLGLDFNLVEKDYYPKGLNYNAMKIKMDNTTSLPEKITAETSQDFIFVRFPSIMKSKKLQGQIWIYRPSDENKDIRLPVSTDTSACMLVPRKILMKGKYILKIDYTADATAYYQEINLYLP